MTTEPRTYALAAAQHLANALDALNRSNVTALDHQRDGSAYGEAHDALTIVVRYLHPPAFAGQIIARHSYDGVSMVTAARTVAEELYHAATERQADTYDAWQALDVDAVADAPTGSPAHDAWYQAQANYMTARALVENADAWMRRTQADCATSTPLPTY